MSENMFLIKYRNANHEDAFAMQSGDAASSIYDLDSMGLPSHLLRDATTDQVTRALHNLPTTPLAQALAVDKLLAPVDDQEVWAAGVTYKRSEEARELESNNSTIYTRVYSASRPELFFKGMGYDVVGTSDVVGIRYDATWSVPEPELVVAINARGEVIGFTIGNDMSSRDIEGENPLYLPQAKVYEKACAIGPRIWLQPGRTTWPDLTIQIAIHRNGQRVFEGETSTASIHRSLADLVEYLKRCKKFPNGAFLFTGTGVVPPESFTLAADDEIRIRIDPIGELVNTVQVVGGRQ